MPSPDPPVRARRGNAALAAGVFVALIAAMLPLLRVVQLGPWAAGALGLAAAVLVTGVVARARRLPAIAVTVLEIVVLILFLTAVFAGPTALLWIVPSLDTVALVPPLVAAAVDEVMLGVAPLAAGTALSFLIVGVVGVLAIVFDHVVLTARLPLLAAVGLVAVSLVPAIAVPGDIDLPAFALLAASLLFLLRVETRARHGDQVARSSPPGTNAGVSATAMGIGAIAVVVALVATPLLPTPVARAGGAGGGGSFIDPTLQLGDDLRQPRQMEVLQVRSTAPTPPYLRVVTLSAFNGTVWQPDEGDTYPLDPDGADFEPIGADSEIAVSEYRTVVDIIDLNSRWLPVAFPAVDVAGLDGDWEALADNRTVVSDATVTSQERAYETVTTVPKPTLEQIRARDAGGAAPPESLELPTVMPAIIEHTAREQTAGALTDYDALIELQTWFRSTEFQYSLDAPVDERFDGQGVNAVADFLTVKKGYCVHYASAFALMARTLGMPSRIVVGYLPGASTGSMTDGQTVYTVSSSDLHAWPEVHFDGIGWIGFEPTNSLGVPTAFLPAVTSASPDEVTTPNAQRGVPAPAPTSTTDAGALRPAEPQGGPGRGPGRSSTDPWPLLAGLAVALLAAAAPAAVGAVRRRMLAASAARGDAVAAWTSVQDLALDLGVAVLGSETPRAFGHRLVHSYGAPPDGVAQLVSAIERVSYSGVGGAGAPLSDAATSVSSALVSAFPLWRRVVARVAPRSLLVRPGSAFAARAGSGPSPAPG